MTICIATSNFPPQSGGIATFYGNLTSLLLQQGHYVIVIMVDYDCKVTEEDEVTMQGGLTKVLLRKSYHTNFEKYKPYFSPGGLDAPNWLATGLAIKSWLLKNYASLSINIIEVSDYGGIAASLISPLLPPVVITGHGSHNQLKRFNPSKNDAHDIIISRLENLSFQHADEVIAHSPMNQVDLKYLSNRTIAFSTAPWLLQPENSINNSDDMVLIVGGLQKVKGAITAAEATQLCVQKNSNFKLCWVGGDTFTAKGIKRMSNYLQQAYPEVWNKNFLWLKEKNNAEVIELISKAAIVVIPSEWETFSYVVLEAASAGKPIIMTETTGASYLFTHGHNAWIIPANNPKALADAIIYLQNNSSICTVLGQNTKDVIVNNFSPEKIVADRIKIYNETIAKRQQAKNIISPDLSFIETYIKPSRKLFYSAKNIVKKIVGR